MPVPVVLWLLWAGGRAGQTDSSVGNGSKACRGRRAMGSATRPRSARAATALAGAPIRCRLHAHTFHSVNHIATIIEGTTGSSRDSPTACTCSGADNRACNPPHWQRARARRMRAHRTDMCLSRGLAGAVADGQCGGDLRRRRVLHQRHAGKGSGMIVFLNLNYRAFFEGLSRVKVQKHGNPTALIAGRRAVCPVRRDGAPDVVSRR